ASFASASLRPDSRSKGNVGCRVALCHAADCRRRFRNHHAASAVPRDITSEENWRHQMAITGKKIAILATHGFEQSELEVPLQTLKDAGATVDVVSPQKGEIKG